MSITAASSRSGRKRPTPGSRIIGRRQEAFAGSGGPR
jgi:hypothetical protein